MLRPQTFALVVPAALVRGRPQRMPFSAADPRSFAALGGEKVGGWGVCVAPAGVGLELSGEHDVVGVVRVGEPELV